MMDAEGSQQSWRQVSAGRLQTQRIAINCDLLLVGRCGGFARLDIVRQSRYAGDEARAIGTGLDMRSDLVRAGPVFAKGEAADDGAAGRGSRRVGGAMSVVCWSSLFWPSASAP